ncbi:MAG TPA: hypothetical protein VJ111_05470, partial [Chitinophagaceae bacterium]|nr:hypothetical protein [Chitinophagaceae bacterium]
FFPTKSPCLLSATCPEIISILQFPKSICTECEYPFGVDGEERLLNFTIDVSVCEKPNTGIKRS